MSATLVDRLAGLAPLAAIPRDELTWMAGHGETHRFEPGGLLFPKGAPLPGLFVVLSGRVSVRVERSGVDHVVREFLPGGISGHLPYSRMQNAPAHAVAEEPVEILLINRPDLKTMTSACYEFTALCVHEMVDRARAFKSDDLRQEKLASLGRLSAGLAHELNNPSSAIVRTARETNACRTELAVAFRALGAVELNDDQRAVLSTLEARAGQAHADAHQPLARADREGAIEDWLDAHGIETAAADALAGTALTIPDLEAASAALTAAQLTIALRAVAANVMAARLTSEIENAATRIHTLVAAVKKHTHMDRTSATEAVSLEPHLADTLTLIGSKARARSVRLELDVEPDLPAVRGIVGELNQVWLNLVDNAIDAAAEAGRVAVTARREQGHVVVLVVDDGDGIAAEDIDRVFDPFFTTKPPGQGTGLGLDIVRGIVHRHGGSIDVTSEPGRTEFRVSLPAHG